MQKSGSKGNIVEKNKTLVASLLVIFIFFIMLLISEGMLALLKYETIYSKMAGRTLNKAYWWKNDPITGPGYVPGQYEKAITEVPDWFYNRLKKVNKQGFHDSDDFDTPPMDTTLPKILFVGDSFTWGASADVDSSYVEVAEHDLKSHFPLVAWNTGMLGTGTNYADYVTKRFLPVQKTDLVVLGFFYNDFRDNLIPYDGIVFFNNSYCLYSYELDNRFNPVRISISKSYKNAIGAYPIEELNFFQREILIKSRLVSLSHQVYRKIMKKHSRQSSDKKEYMYSKTKTYLESLRNYVKENNVEILVLLIPERNDLRGKTGFYLKALEIFNELDIKYIEILDEMTEEDYAVNPKDEHWSNSGHRKAGLKLSETIMQMDKFRGKLHKLAR
jgi:hypothetical protein